MVSGALEEAAGDPSRSGDFSEYVASYALVLEIAHISSPLVFQGSVRKVPSSKEHTREEEHMCSSL